MIIPRPSAPFERLEIHGESITLDVSAKQIIIPTGDQNALPSHNEYTLDDSLDYMPGSVHVTQGDGVYLTDILGNNTSTDLSAGKLGKLGNLIVDVVAHTITEEFIVENTNTSNSPTNIETCNTTPAGWGVTNCTLTLDSIEKQEGANCFKIISTSADFNISKAVSIDLSQKSFISIKIKGAAGRTAHLLIGNGYSAYKYYNLALSASWKTYIIPLNKPSGVVGTPDFSNVQLMRIGNYSGSAGDIIYIDDIKSDVGLPVHIEIQVPDVLASPSLTLQTHNGTIYQTCRVDSLDGEYEQISSTMENCTFLNGTKLDDIYGAVSGLAVYPIGESGDTVNGSIGSMTYGSNNGTLKRIGMIIYLPPSDDDQTDINKIRLKLVLTYAPDTQGNYSSSFNFEDSTNSNCGLQNSLNPYIILLNEPTNEIEFFLYSTRVRNVSFKQNEYGIIYELTLYSGNGGIYHGRITHALISQDSNSDLIPDCLDINIDGSVTKFLRSYDFLTILYKSSDDYFYVSSDGYTLEERR